MRNLRSLPQRISNQNPNLLPKKRIRVEHAVTDVAETIAPGWMLHPLQHRFTYFCVTGSAVPGRSTSFSNARVCWANGSHNFGAMLYPFRIMAPWLR